MSQSIWYTKKPFDVHFLSCKTIGDRYSIFEKPCVSKKQHNIYCQRFDAQGTNIFTHIGVDGRAQSVLLVFRTLKGEYIRAPKRYWPMKWHVKSQNHHLDFRKKSVKFEPAAKHSRQKTDAEP